VPVGTFLAGAGKEKITRLNKEDADKEEALGEMGNYYFVEKKAR